MDTKRIERILLGIALILLGIAISLSLSFFPMLSLSGLPFAIGGWWVANKDQRKAE
jgi:hypothetical protein